MKKQNTKTVDPNPSRVSDRLGDPIAKNIQEEVKKNTLCKQCK